jgi:hypothetical protein
VRKFEAHRITSQIHTGNKQQSWDFSLFVLSVNIFNLGDNAVISAHRREEANEILSAVKFHCVQDTRVSFLHMGCL